MDGAEIIAYLLEHYWELVEPLNGPSGVRGTGERLPQMPPTYTASVRQLERELRLMRAARAPLPLLRRHALDYYMGAERHRRDAFLVVHRSGRTEPCLDAQGLPRSPREGERILRTAAGEPALRPVLCVERPSQARKDLADAGCRYLAQRFPFRPQIPSLLAA